jgi:phosphate-selective porin OprO/OprP
MRAGIVLFAATFAVGMALSSAPARADDDTKAELDALKKRVAELESKQKAEDDSLRKAVERISGPTSPTDFHVYWNTHDGLKLETDDKAFSLHIGGRLQYDFEWFKTSNDLKHYEAPAMTSALGKQADADEIRRMRLQFDGTLYSDTFYKLELEFAQRATAVTSTGGKPTDVTNGDLVGIRNAYVGTTALQPFATVMVGHFGEPFNLETVTSDNFITFMERGLTYAFAPDYQTGIQLSNAVCDQRVTWAIGEFRPQYGTDNSGSSFQGYEKNNSGYDTTARVTGLPWYQDEKTGDTFGLLHLGAAVDVLTDANPNSPVEFSSAPEMHLASAFVDTGAMKDIENYELYNEELAFVYGPFSAQAEAAQAQMVRTGDKNLTFNAAYGYVSYFLTGEHRGYSKSSGCFDRVNVLHNLGTDKDGHRGWGAWELAARYSYIDLDSEDIHGGRMGDVTLGLNWYLNPNVRVMLNYVYSKVLENTAAAGSAGKGGNLNALGVRFQVDL